MNIPRYWAKATAQVRTNAGMQSFSAWRWSNDSLQDASRKAQEAAESIARRIQTGQELRAYPYGQRAMREEVVERINRPDGRELGIITRNSYGALVLNAANTMFVDIDLDNDNAAAGIPPTVIQGISLAKTIMKMFGARPPSEQAASQLAAANPPPASEAAALRTLEAWTNQNNGLGLRVYRTAGGLRALVTSVTFDPTLPQTSQILKGLNCDPLYIQLCQAQECFRARLTPKPWRVGLQPMPVRWPFETQSVEAKARAWIDSYTQRSAPVTVCRLVKAFGPPNVHPDIAPILEMHDRLALGNPSLRLA